MTIAYLGTPIGGADTVAAQVLQGRHGFVSFYEPRQLDIVKSVCASYAVDCGSYSAWRSGGPVTDWMPYYKWVDGLDGPLDFAVIPDVIDGTEKENDRLIEEWPLGHLGAPVWHLHESFARLDWLVRKFPRVCLGSSGDYATPGTEGWWRRMGEAMTVACREDGRPRTMLHGLRMMNPTLYAIPFHSVDSTSVARNCGLDAAWTGRNEPPTKGWKAVVLAARFEHNQAALRWKPNPQLTLGAA